MARYMRGYGQYKLGDPIVGAGIAWHGPGTYLVYPRPRQFTRQARYRLSPPQVVNSAGVFSGPKVYLNVMTPERLRQTVTRRRPTYQISPPVVVGAGIAWHGPGTVYAKEPLRSIRRRKTSYFLRPPAVAPVVFLAAPIGVTLATSSRGRAKYFLRPPADTIGIEDQGKVSVHLAASRRGVPKSELGLPGDTIGLEDQGQVQTWLTYSRRGAAKSRLFPPSVITPAVSAFYGPQVHLARIKHPPVTYDLAGPVVVAVGGALGWIGIQLAPSRRPIAKSVLRAPAVVAAVVQIYYGPAVHLTRIRPRRVLSALRAPAILTSNLPTATTLAPQRRGLAKSRLAPPQVVFTAVEISGPKTWLAYSRRGTAKSDLKPPTDTVGIEDQGQIFITLAPQRRGTAKPQLGPPTVVFLAVEIYGPEIHLARIKPPPTLSALRPPSDVVDQQDLGLLRVHLAYSRRGRPIYVLRPFSARAFEVSYGPQVTLASSRRPVTKSHLSPPAVVAPVVSYGPLQWLAYSRRGTPKPFLNPPAVVSTPPAYTQVLPPALAYSRRGRPIYKLRLPTRVFPVLFFGPQVTLRPQARGIPKSFLRPPQVVRLAIEIYGPAVELTYSRRPKTRSELLPPTVVEPFFARPTHTLLARITHPPVQHVLKPPTVVRLAVEIYGPSVELTYSRRPITRSRLLPPAVVLRLAFFTNINLTYSRRGAPTYLLKPPSVVRAAFVASPVQVHLARITPPPVLSALKPPSLVGTPEAFYGPLTTLVRIRPPRVHYLLRVTLVRFRRPHGDICGFDIAGSFVCSLEVPGSQVTGGTATRFGISGSSRAGSKVSGSEQAGGSASGSDRKAT